MATIIDVGDGSFIAGDPPAELDLGQHWCEWCAGAGLDYDWDGNLEICTGCFGRCVRDCDDTACPEHSALHPLDMVDRLAEVRGPLTEYAASAVSYYEEKLGAGTVDLAWVRRMASCYSEESSRAGRRSQDDAAAALGLSRMAAAA